MKFIINKTGNNFGDKFISIRDITNDQLIELDAVESEHSHLDYQLKKLRVIRLSPDDKLQLLLCLDQLHIIGCKPVDIKLLKAELKEDFSERIIKLSKVIHKLDLDIQQQILKFI